MNHQAAPYRPVHIIGCKLVLRPELVRVIIEHQVTGTPCMYRQLGNRGRLLPGVFVAQGPACTGCEQERMGLIVQCRGGVMLQSLIAPRDAGDGQCFPSLGHLVLFWRYCSSAYIPGGSHVDYLGIM